VKGREGKGKGEKGSKKARSKRSEKERKHGRATMHGREQKRTQ
jgi:hypothetical protein